MPEESVLSDEVVRELSAVGQVDILVGVPTLNNRNTIERVVRAVQLGLTKYFPRERSALINPDGGSTDGTLDVVKSATITDYGTLLSANPLRTFHRVTAPYKAISGKDEALRILLAVCDLLRAKVCVIVSPEVESITPEWMDSLVRPAYREQFDFVAPVYQRPKFDGLLVKNLLSPMVQAAYGWRVREPVGGELGMSGRLASHYLEQYAGHEDMTRLGLEVWMTTTAIAGGFRVCEAFLGPKIVAANPLGQDVVAAIQEVVGALFRSLELHESYWLARNGSEGVPFFGFQYDLALEPLRVSKKRILHTFRNDVEQLRSILESILTPQTFADIRNIAELPDKQFRYPDELWVKGTYEFAAAYHHSVINRDHLLQALAPLYRARVSSFVLENGKADSKQIEKRLEGVGAEFERLKPYLREQWSTKAVRGAQ